MKRSLITIFFAISITMAMTLTCYAENMPTPPEKSREELYHDLFITLLLPHIDQPINDYYSKLLTESPTVYPYQVDVISAERVYGYRSFRFLVTLEVLPVVGPHISVGKDRLTFDIGSGMTKLTEFKHLETHELPPNWQDIIKR